MEGGDKEMGALWEETKQWSLQEFKHIYAWLGSRFDHDFCESEVADVSCFSSSILHSCSEFFFCIPFLVWLLFPLFLLSCSLWLLFVQEGVRMTKEFYEKGLLVKSDGAIGCDLSKWKLGFCMLLKSNGSGLYATKDIALAAKKFEKFNIDQSIYVVDVAQTMHFQQVCCSHSLEMLIDLFVCFVSRCSKRLK